MIVQSTPGAESSSKSQSSAFIPSDDNVIVISTGLNSTNSSSNSLVNSSITTNSTPSYTTALKGSESALPLNISSSANRSTLLPSCSFALPQSHAHATVQPRVLASSQTLSPTFQPLPSSPSIPYSHLPSVNPFSTNPPTSASVISVPRGLTSTTKSSHHTSQGSNGHEPSHLVSTSGLAISLTSAANLPIISGLDVITSTMTTGSSTATSMTNSSSLFDSNSSYSLSTSPPTPSGVCPANLKSPVACSTPTNYTENDQSNLSRANSNNGSGGCPDSTTPPESFNGLSGLNISRKSKTLDLGHRNLESLPDEIINLIRDEVERLAISHNEIVSFPDRLVECAKLRYLNARYNQLQEISPSVLQLTSLEILDLSKNKLRNISEAIGNLKALKVLALSRNLLKRLPFAIGDMTALRVLKVDHNPLVFPPSEICNYVPGSLKSSGLVGDDGSGGEGTNQLKSENDTECLLTQQIKEFLHEARKNAKWQYLVVPSLETSDDETGDKVAGVNIATSIPSSRTARPNVTLKRLHGQKLPIRSSIDGYGLEVEDTSSDIPPVPRVLEHYRNPNGLSTAPSQTKISGTSSRRPLPANEMVGASITSPGPTLNGSDTSGEVSTREISDAAGRNGGGIFTTSQCQSGSVTNETVVKSSSGVTIPMRSKRMGIVSQKPTELLVFQNEISMATGGSPVSQHSRESSLGSSRNTHSSAATPSAKCVAQSVDSQNNLSVMSTSSSLTASMLTLSAATPNGSSLSTSINHSGMSGWSMPTANGRGVSIAAGLSKNAAFSQNERPRVSRSKVSEDSGRSSSLGGSADTFLNRTSYSEHITKVSPGTISANPSENTKKLDIFRLHGEDMTGENMEKWTRMCDAARHVLFAFSQMRDLAFSLTQLLQQLNVPCHKEMSGQMKATYDLLIDLGAYMFQYDSMQDNGKGMDVRDKNEGGSKNEVYMSAKSSHNNGRDMEGSDVNVLGRSGSDGSSGGSKDGSFANRQQIHYRRGQNRMGNLSRYQLMLIICSRTRECLKRSSIIWMRMSQAAGEIVGKCPRSVTRMLLYILYGCIMEMRDCAKLLNVEFIEISTSNQSIQGPLQNTQFQPQQQYRQNSQSSESSGIINHVYTSAEGNSVMGVEYGGPGMNNPRQVSGPALVRILNPNGSYGPALGGRNNSQEPDIGGHYVGQKPVGSRTKVSGSSQEVANVLHGSKSVNMGTVNTGNNWVAPQVHNVPPLPRHPAPTPQATRQSTSTDMKSTLRSNGISFSAGLTQDNHTNIMTGNITNGTYGQYVNFGPTGQQQTHPTFTGLTNRSIIRDLTNKKPGYQASVHGQLAGEPTLQNQWLPPPLSHGQQANMFFVQGQPPHFATEYGQVHAANHESMSANLPSRSHQMGSFINTSRPGTSGEPGSLQNNSPMIGPSSGVGVGRGVPVNLKRHEGNCVNKHDVSRTGTELSGGESVSTGKIEVEESVVFEQVYQRMKHATELVLNVFPIPLPAVFQRNKEEAFRRLGLVEKAVVGSGDAVLSTTMVPSLSNNGGDGRGDFQRDEEKDSTDNSEAATRLKATRTQYIRQWHILIHRSEKLVQAARNLNARLRWFNSGNRFDLSAICRPSEDLWKLANLHCQAWCNFVESLKELSVSNDSLMLSTALFSPDDVNTTSSAVPSGAAQTVMAKQLPASTSSSSSSSVTSSLVLPDHLRAALRPLHAAHKDLTTAIDHSPWRDLARSSSTAPTPVVNQASTIATSIPLPPPLKGNPVYFTSSTLNPA